MVKSKTHLEGSDAKTVSVNSVINRNEKKMSDRVEMKVTGLTIDPFTNMPIIILKDLDEHIALPIWIGLIEASSIATELEQIDLSRPMTHDLIKTLLETLDVHVTQVEIVDLTDNTFFANVHLQNETQSLVIDARPSDAIAIALRTKARIFVHRTVIEKSRQIESATEQSDEQMRSEKWTEILENLTPADFGKYKM